MPLDPLSALSVAVNIIQLVDFTTRLVSTSVDIYQNDALLEHSELRAAAEQLKTLKTGLVASADADNPQTQTGEDAPKTTTATLENLFAARDYCLQCSDELIGAIDKATVSGKFRKWKSVRLALSSVLGDRKIEEAVDRLSSARQQVILFMLIHSE
jgi:hypothetical protein